MKKRSHDQDLPDKMQETIERQAMLDGVKKAVVAFSSGPDSVCLLDMLVQKYGGKLQFYVVYVNHGLRPQKILEAEEDLARFYANKYGLKYRILAVEVRPGKTGLEAQAREARYQALICYMRQVKAQRILLGHNLDDVMETFFINLVRGSGTKGMGSIPPVRLPFVRPLINLKKSEIMSYLIRRGLKYATDETNKDLKFRRNLLRLKIIPHLARLNPNFYESMKKTIEILRTDDEYLQELSEHAFQKVVTKRKNYLVLDLKRILRYNDAIVNRVIFAVIKNLKGSLAGYASKHIDSILSLKGKTSGKIIHLPKHLYAQKIYDKILLGNIPIIRLLKKPVGLSGNLRVAGNMELRTSIVTRYKPGRKRESCEFFDVQDLKLPLYVRSRREGDVLVTKAGRKKIKKLFNEKKILARERDNMMILCDQRGIIWVPGVARAYRGFINRGTKKILKVEFEYID